MDIGFEGTDRVSGFYSKTSFKEVLNYRLKTVFEINYFFEIKCTVRI
jgi:hypothetical protein